MTRLREVFATHSSYQERYAGDGGKPDNIFLAKSKAVRGLADLVEEIVYSAAFDPTLKVAIKARKVAEEVGEYEKVNERLEAVLDDLQAEKAQQTKNQPIESGPSGSGSSASNEYGKESENKADNEADEQSQGVHLSASKNHT